ncbi:MAG: RodZ domain-containing protein [Bryobacteraceae bacterium]|jgi:cytoskeleton protein RodZ
MNSIGERLRQERLRQDFNLQQIAELTKINLVFLEAIEADDLEKLPGIFFTRSFVRQYARALGLDEADFDQELNRLAACERVPTIEQPPVSPEALNVPPMAARGRRASRQRPLGSAVVLLLIVAACSVIFWLWQRTREIKPASSGQSASATAPQPTAAPAPQPASPPPAPSTEPAPGPATETAAPETPPPGQTAATQTASIQVRIHAIEATWVRIAADGRYLFSGILRPDETRPVEANQLVQLRIGNAAGIEVSWNGKPVGSIGPAGQVRNVEFTAAGFKVLALPAPERVSPGDEP